jgi:hypothetical protein
MITIIVHTGHLSGDNGAKYPLSYFVDWYKAVGATPVWGDHYGDDRAEVAESDVVMAIELLNENNMLYKVQGTHAEWQGRS